MKAREGDTTSFCVRLNHMKSPTKLGCFCPTKIAITRDGSLPTFSFLVDAPVTGQRSACLLGRGGCGRSNFLGLPSPVLYWPPTLPGPADSALGESVCALKWPMWFSQFLQFPIVLQFRHSLVSYLHASCPRAVEVECYLNGGRVAVKSNGFGIKQPKCAPATVHSRCSIHACGIMGNGLEFELQLCHLLALRPWANCLCSLSLSLL